MNAHHGQDDDSFWDRKQLAYHYGQPAGIIRPKFADDSSTGTKKIVGVLCHGYSTTITRHYSSLLYLPNLTSVPLASAQCMWSSPSYIVGVNMVDPRDVCTMMWSPHATDILKFGTPLCIEFPHNSGRVRGCAIFVGILTRNSNAGVVHKCMYWAYSKVLKKNKQYLYNVQINMKLNKYEIDCYFDFIVYLYRFHYISGRWNNNTSIKISSASIRRTTFIY
jgi:hypothetical protein